MIFKRIWYVLVDKICIDQICFTHLTSPHSLRNILKYLSDSDLASLRNSSLLPVANSTVYNWIPPIPLLFEPFSMWSIWLSDGFQSIFACKTSKSCRAFLRRMGCRLNCCEISFKKICRRSTKFATFCKCFKVKWRDISFHSQKESEFD